VLKVHLAEELGITDETMARPVQAMVVSMVSFAIGAALPLGAMAAASAAARAWITVGVALIALVVLGATGARLGGAPRGRASLRVLVGGAGAMALTALVGKLFGAAIG
jgi:VIT1/CCC1 family predicted Fe2+/Mn2+ transporter